MSEVAIEMWDWAQLNGELNGNWLSVTHIPGIENILADLHLRSFRDPLQWSLNPEIFQNICEIFGTPEVDLFASRFKGPKYVSWEPQPENWRTDAFSFRSTDTQTLVYGAHMGMPI